MATTVVVVEVLTTVVLVLGLVLVRPVDLAPVGLGREVVVGELGRVVVDVPDVGVPSDVVVGGGGGAVVVVVRGVVPGPVDVLVVGGGTGAPGVVVDGTEVVVRSGTVVLVGPDVSVGAVTVVLVGAVVLVVVVLLLLLLVVDVGRVVVDALVVVVAPVDGVVRVVVGKPVVVVVAGAGSEGSAPADGVVSTARATRVEAEAAIPSAQVAGVALDHMRLGDSICTYVS